MPSRAAAAALARVRKLCLAHPVEQNPEAYFVPACVGHLGWVGVRLDRELPWPEIAAVIEHAYATRAPERATKAPKRRAATTGLRAR